jgi:nucleoside-diphosphate-sugar epimerase
VLAPTHKQLDLVHGNENQALDIVFAKAHPDVVVHCAAAVGGIGANEAEPGRFFYDNAAMGINLMEVARHWETKMVTIGTACMYPEFVPTPQVETDLWNGYPAPVTAPYAFAKRAILEMGQAYRLQYGFNAVFVIPTNLYGPRDNFDLESSHVIPGMIRRFAEADGGDVTLWGTGMPTRDFLYVQDAARGIADAVENYDEPDPINLGTGVDVSIKHLAETIGTLTGFTGKIIWDKSRPDGTPYRRLSTGRAHKALGWSATISLETGLERTIHWWKANSE